MTKGAAVYKQFFSDMLYFPVWGRGVYCVWLRNFLYFRQTFFAAVAWIFLEPVLYLFALGFGLGRFVTEIDGQSYAQFIAPAMMATTGMFTAFFEGTYSTYTKLTRQNTYHTIMLTPVAPDEILIGEILWATSKAFFSVCSVAVVMVVLGLVPMHGLLPSLGMLLLMCWVFASFGVWISTLAKSYEWFSYFQSCIITPMSLFCGTYFPLSQLPDGMEQLAYALPLTHALQSTRMFFAGELTAMFIFNISFLLFAGIFFSNLAAARFERKLVL